MSIYEDFDEEEEELKPTNPYYKYKEYKNKEHDFKSDGKGNRNNGGSGSFFKTGSGASFKVYIKNIVYIKGSPHEQKLANNKFLAKNRRMIGLEPHINVDISEKEVNEVIETGASESDAINILIHEKIRTKIEKLFMVKINFIDFSFHGPF